MTVRPGFLVAGGVVGLLAIAAIISVSGDEGRTASNTLTPAKAVPVAVADAAVTLPFGAAELEANLRKQTAKGNLFSRGSLEIRHMTAHEISMTFHFKQGESVEAEMPEVATMGLAKLTIDDLIAAGFNPREQWLMVHVWAEQPAERSVTGGAQVRVFGSANYDFSDDKLTYEAGN